MDKIAVLGGGSWGTALASLLADNGYEINIYDISEAKVREINQERENSFLPGYKLSDEITATTDLKQAIQDAKVVIIVVPSHVVRDVAKQLKGLLSEDVIIVSAAKGIEAETFYRMSEVLKDELSNDLADNIVALSGPTHAEEVISKDPTTIVAANENKEIAQKVQDIFMADYFRVYTNPDIIGVELGGAIKNIIAVASGISAGLGYGDNAMAALITRGIAEIKRLGVALGAESMTFAGLTGLGDLIVTCASEHSRNRRVGYKIGSGKTLDEALDEMKMVAEGVKAAKIAHILANKHDIEMPLTEQVYQILFEDKNPQEAVSDLMMRGKKYEIEDVAKEKEW